MCQRNSCQLSFYSNRYYVVLQFCNMPNSANWTWNIRNNHVHQHDFRSSLPGRRFILGLVVVLIFRAVSKEILKLGSYGSWLVTVVIELWRMDDMSLVVLYFWVLFVWLGHASLSWWLESSRAVENYLELFCPYKDHSAGSTASSRHPTFWSRVDPSCWQHFLYSLSLACYLICFC